MNEMLPALVLPPTHAADQQTADLDVMVESRAATVMVDEKALAYLALAGDLAAFNQLVERVQGSAYNTACRMLNDEAAAADVLQESLIKAFRALGTYRGGSFKSWFLRILINSCYDALRVQKRRSALSLDELNAEGEPTLQLTDPGDQPEAHVARMELRQWLNKGIAALPIEQRVAVLLFDVEGYSYNEIAEITGVSMGTLKSRLSRGRLRLRDYLLRHRVLDL